MVSVTSGGHRNDNFSTTSPRMGGREGQNKQAQRPGGEGSNGVLGLAKLGV